MLITLLGRHAGTYRRELAAVVVLQFCQALASLTLPALNARIIDNGVVTGDTYYIWTRGLLMLGIAMVQVVLNVAAVYFGAKVAMGFGRDVRTSLFHQVTDYSTREVSDFGPASLITRITNDVQQVQMLVLLSCTLLAAAPITLVGGVFMALREDIGLSAILLVSIPVLVVCIGLIVSRMVPGFRRMQERIDDVNRVLREQITGIRVVRAFVREPYERRRFAGANERLTSTSLYTGRVMALMFPTVMVVVNVSSVAAVWIGADRIVSGDMQIGSLIAFLSYLTLILMAVMMATFMAVLTPRAAVSAERIEEVLQTPSSIKAPSDPVREFGPERSLELDGATFCYPGAEEPVLSDVSFRVEPGHMLAIIGSTGAGKTTLLNLIPRLIDVTSGAVRVHGTDVHRLDPDLLWKHVGVVPQKPFLFSGTVASNLRIADPDASDDDLWRALEIAQAADFVRDMPDGLDEPIVQGGSNVSGGQRQRLAIARALVRRPDIYLFDDSFSALDLATDARLRSALEPHVRDAIVVVVAQRVSSIVGADQILVLEDGRTVGIGTHEELLERCPTYVEIVDSQLNAQEAA